MSIKNTQELRDMLLESIEKVRNGDIDTKVASSIIGLSGQVIKSCMVEIAFAKAKSLMKDLGSTVLTSGKK